MRSKLNYFLAFACAIAGLGMTYMNLNRDVGWGHWIVVAVMLYGAFEYYRKAEKTAE